MDMLKFPKLFHETLFTESNKTLFKNHGESAILCSPTTVVISPYNKFLEMKFNGHRHHYHYQLPINFSDEKYEKIYESLRDNLDRLIPIGNPIKRMFPISSKKEINFSKMSKAELLEFIESGKRYTKDESVYFSDDLFDVTYTKTPRFINHVNKDGVLKQDCYEVGRHRISNPTTVFDRDYNKLLLNNKDLIGFYTKNKITHLYNIEVAEFYITNELSVYEIYINGSNVKS